MNVSDYLSMSVVSFSAYLVPMHSKSSKKRSYSSTNSSASNVPVECGLWVNRKQLYSLHCCSVPYKCEYLVRLCFALIYGGCVIRLNHMNCGSDAFCPMDCIYWSVSAFIRCCWCMWFQIVMETSSWSCIRGIWIQLIAFMEKQQTAVVTRL